MRSLESTMDLFVSIKGLTTKKLLKSLALVYSTLVFSTLTIFAKFVSFMIKKVSKLKVSNQRKIIIKTFKLEAQKIKIK